MRTPRPLQSYHFRGSLPTPHKIAVYASPWSSPSTPQHSLPGGRYPLPGPDFHRLEHASFPGAPQVGPLLDQIEGAVVSVTGDDAYDRDDVYAELGPLSCCGRGRAAAR